MKKWFISRLKRGETLQTLEGNRIKFAGFSKVLKPRSFSKQKKGRNLLPEVQLTLGATKLDYQLIRPDVKFMALTKKD